MAVSVRLEAMTPGRFATWSVQSRAGFIEQQVASGTMPAPEARYYAASQFQELLPSGLETPGHHVLCAYAADVEVGSLWLGLKRRDAEIESFVYDIVVSPQARRSGYGRAIMQAGEREASSRGAKTMRLNVFGHNDAAHQMYEGLGYVVVTTHLARRLDAVASQQPLSPAVRLEPLSALQLDAALEHAHADYAKLLTEGVGTPGHFLWTVHAEGMEVGMIWLGIDLKSDGWHAFGFDCSVKEELGRHGYGRAVLAAVEQLCRERDVVSIGLNVPGCDPEARLLYEQAGFHVTASLMSKVL